MGPRPTGRRARGTQMACIVVALLGACQLTFPTGAAAQTAADFYRGKIINLMIGVNVGGSYDRDARAWSRAISERTCPATPPSCRRT